jgi:DNA-directed RNA polymerase specialized sigma24 family protein
VLALQQDGLTQRDIATEIGKSVGTVNAIIKRAKARKGLDDA